MLLKATHAGQLGIFGVEKRMYFGGRGDHRLAHRKGIIGTFLLSSNAPKAAVKQAIAIAVFQKTKASNALIRANLF